MNEPATNSLEEYLGDLPDPRGEGRCDHLLGDIIRMAICAVLCGAESWDDVEEFGESKQAWLRQFLALPHGIPSHDTFRRVFSLLEATAFQERFMRWVEATFHVQREQVIALDGKSVRGSRDALNHQACLHVVSAWATASGLALGQRKVQVGENENVAIPELLAELYLRGCIVTIDAIGCQKEITQQIIEQHADYVLALKAN